MTFDQVIEKLKMENAASLLKYGLWKDIPTQEQADAIQGEYTEWYRAYIDGDIDGEHGEIAEAIDLMNVCMRRVMFLTGDPHA